MPIPESHKQMIRRVNYREALKMLSLKMGVYHKFLDAYNKYALRNDRRAFDNYMLPWLWENYDIQHCPSWQDVPELHPDHWPTAKPLKMPTEPPPSPWNQNENN